MCTTITAQCKWVWSGSGCGYLEPHICWCRLPLVHYKRVGRDPVAAGSLPSAVSIGHSSDS